MRSLLSLLAGQNTPKQSLLSEVLAQCAKPDLAHLPDLCGELIENLGMGQLGGINDYYHQPIASEDTIQNFVTTKDSVVTGIDAAKLLTYLRNQPALASTKPSHQPSRRNPLATLRIAISKPEPERYEEKTALRRAFGYALVAAYSNNLEEQASAYYHLLIIIDLYPNLFDQDSKVQCKFFVAMGVNPDSMAIYKNVKQRDFESYRHKLAALNQYDLSDDESFNAFQQQFKELLEQLEGHKKRLKQLVGVTIDHEYLKTYIREWQYNITLLQPYLDKYCLAFNERYSNLPRVAEKYRGLLPDEFQFLANLDSAALESFLRVRQQFHLLFMTVIDHLEWMNFFDDDATEIVFIHKIKKSEISYDSWSNLQADFALFCESVTLYKKQFDIIRAQISNLTNASRQRLERVKKINPGSVFVARTFSQIIDLQKSDVMIRREAAAIGSVITLLSDEPQAEAISALEQFQAYEEGLREKINTTIQYHLHAIANELRVSKLTYRANVDSVLKNVNSVNDGVRLKVKLHCMQVSLNDLEQKINYFGKQAAELQALADSNNQALPLVEALQKAMAELTRIHQEDTALYKTLLKRVEYFALRAATQQSLEKYQSICASRIFTCTHESRFESAERVQNKLAELDQVKPAAFEAEEKRYNDLKEMINAERTKIAQLHKEAYPCWPRLFRRSHSRLEQAYTAALNRMDMVNLH